MSTSNPLDDRVDALGKASRRAALLSLVGFLVVLAAMWYAYAGIRTLEQQRSALLSDTEKYRRELTEIQADLGKSRAALAASRAAINAFHAGRLEEAVALYDEALAADPENAYLQNLRAYSLFRLGKVEAAIRGQRLSLAADPNYAWGYFDLARFLYASNPPQVEEALRAEAKAIELRPQLASIMKSDGEFQTVRRRANVQ